MSEPTLKFKVHLSGAQEVPPVASENESKLTLEFSHDFSHVDYCLSIDDPSDVTAAHLHQAAAGNNGPVVAPLSVNQSDDKVCDTLRNEDLTNGLVTIAQLYQLIKDGLLYANVHTNSNPDGELRGQIFF